jgi:ParB-like chromosome segregation protein Spo0J
MSDRVIENIGVEDLRPYGNNSRTHSKAQLEQIVASINEFGFTNPILITGDNTIIAGHGRFLAARKMGIAVVPCIRLGDLSPEQIRAYVIADNQLALQAGWDKELLSLELGSLKRADFDIGVIGFTEKDLEKLLAEPEKASGLPDQTSTDELAVIVSCGSPDEQSSAYDLLVGAGYTCRTAALKGVVTVD